MTLNLESVALQLHHNAVQIISITLVRTNTAKIVDLLEGMFGVDLPARDDNDDNEEEVESIISEEEDQLPEVGTTTHAAAQ